MRIFIGLSALFLCLSGCGGGGGGAAAETSTNQSLAQTSTNQSLAQTATNAIASVSWFISVSTQGD